MGRQKQTTPLQRSPSSQLVNMTLDDAQGPEKHANGSAKGHLDAQGAASSKPAATLDPGADSPGLMQLLICVLGIYAAL